MNKKYWSRGGIIGLVVSVVWAVWGAIRLGFENIDNVIATNLLIAILAATLVGAVVGLIYGKLKR